MKLNKRKERRRWKAINLFRAFSNEKKLELLTEFLKTDTKLNFGPFLRKWVDQLNESRRRRLANFLMKKLDLHVKPAYSKA